MSTIYTKLYNLEYKCLRHLPPLHWICSYTISYLVLLLKQFYQKTKPLCTQAHYSLKQWSFCSGKTFLNSGTIGILTQVSYFTNEGGMCDIDIAHKSISPLLCHKEFFILPKSPCNPSIFLLMPFIPNSFVWAQHKDWDFRRSLLNFQWYLVTEMI